MTKRVQIDSPSSLQGQAACEELEKGNILFFPKVPFTFAQEDQDFLLKQKQTGAKNRKNISYKPHKGAISNADISTEESFRLLEVMRRFSENSTDFVRHFLSPYAQHLQVDPASFRPFQEKGRKLRLRARNDLLHIDAFPTRPMHNGKRILRLFININPEQPRKWITSEDFSQLLQRFATHEKMHFPKSVSHLSYKVKQKFKRLCKQAKIPVTIRSPYDDFMLRFHHFLKENEEFQKNTPKDHWEFPPNSCWMVFTDYVSHAALQGQYALEQTFLVPKKTLVNQEKSPLSILEMHLQQIMVDPKVKK